MKKIKILALSSVLASSLYSFEQPNVDYISMSMGGAGIASSYGAMSAYKNPALLSSKDNNRSLEIGIDVGVGVYDYKVGDDLYKIDDSDVSWTLDEIANGKGSDEQVKNNATTIISSLDNLSSNIHYLALTPSAGLAVKRGKWSLAIYTMATAKLSPIIDKNRLEYIFYDEANDAYVHYDQYTGEYTESDEDTYKARSVEYAMKKIETTYIDVRGILLTEVPLSYSDRFESGDTIVNYGVSFKYMKGSTFKTRILFTDDNYDPMDELDKNKVDTTTFGVDLGMLVRPSDGRFKLAIVGKNLNTPKFDTIDPGVEYKLKPKVTAGIAYSISERFDFAMDCDMTETEDILLGRKSQYVGGGINFHPLSWFSLRAGAKKNLSDDYEGMVYTAGASFGLKWLQIDAAVQASENSGEYDGEKIPRYMKANLSLVSKWK